MGIYASMLASKTKLNSLKIKEDNVDVDKCKAAPADLSELSNVVNDGVIKKTVYDKWVCNFNAINTEIPITRYLFTIWFRKTRYWIENWSCWQKSTQYQWSGQKE